MQTDMTPGRTAAIELVGALVLGLAMVSCATVDETPTGCGLGGSAALPGGAPELAFSCQVRPNNRYHGDILIVRPGEPARLLTHGEGWNYDPGWSPDGRRIVFTSTRTGTEQLYTMSAEGTGVAQLTHTIGSVGEASWSPDGTSIAFSSGAAGLSGPLGVIHYPSDIYVAEADGTGARRLTFGGGLNGSPKWSPDGTRIVFVSDRRGPYEVWVMAADGSGQRPLTSVGQNGGPSWSPDGTQIVFHSERDYPGGYQASIYLMGADGSRQRRLVDSNGDYPDWSHDGRWIAFANNNDLFAVRPDGSGLTRLTSDGSGIPAWAPQ